MGPTWQGLGVGELIIVHARLRLGCRCQAQRGGGCDMDARSPAHADCAAARPPSCACRLCSLQSFMDSNKDWVHPFKQRPADPNPLLSLAGKRASGGRCWF